MNPTTKTYLQKIKNYWQSDAIYIVLLVFTLLACVYTIDRASDYQTQCNEHWYEQVEHLQKCCNLIDDNIYYPFNQSFDLFGGKG